MFLAPQPIPSLNSVPNFSSLPGISGYEMVITGATTLSLRAGYARGQFNDAAITYPPANVPGLPSTLDLDISTVGALGCWPVGLDVLALTNDTVFGIYVQDDTSGVNKTNGEVNLPTAIIATADNVLLPGYDSYVRVGLAYVNTDGELISMQQNGSGDIRIYTLAEPVSVLDSGSATSRTAVNLSSGDGPIVPDWTIEVNMLISFTADSQSDVLTLCPTGLAGAPYVFQNAAAVKAEFNAPIVPGKNDTPESYIDYSVTSSDDTVSLSVAGWKDNLMLSQILPGAPIVVGP